MNNEQIEAERKNFELAILFRAIPVEESKGCIVRDERGEYINPVIAWGFWVWLQAKNDKRA